MTTGATIRQVLVDPPRADVAEVARAPLAPVEVRIAVAYAGICAPSCTTSWPRVVVASWRLTPDA